ncbi:hypothetical protein RHGRI_029114 [Rhododendron griersonianum]|uniref:Replication factor A protein 1 n=1 Tax=Rhododendron griersonianum TaxID=479676 RepID=A0AAV6II28_9ERIC|nr:hypothetical protein RHGRI_029114 [Rhododendron griersonianum]
MPFYIGEKGNVLDTRQDVNCILINCRKASVQERKLYLIASIATAKKVKFEVLLTDASGSMTATIFENHAEEYFLVDEKTIMKYTVENDQNVVAIFPKLAIENEYWIQLKRHE